jgi:hypothetical protein
VKRRGVGRGKEEQKKDKKRDKMGGKENKVEKIKRRDCKKRGAKRKEE